MGFAKKIATEATKKVTDKIKLSSANLTSSFSKKLKFERNTESVGVFFNPHYKFSYNIKTMDGKILYEAKGKEKTIHQSLSIYKAGKEIALIKETTPRNHKTYEFEISTTEQSQCMIVKKDGFSYKFEFEPSSLCLYECSNRKYLLKDADYNIIGRISDDYIEYEKSAYELTIVLVAFAQVTFFNKGMHLKSPDLG